MAVDPFASDQDRPALSHTPSDPSPAAENAFWAAPEERRDKIRAAGLPFDERSHHPFREAHAERRLISGLVAGVARYKRGRGTPGRLPSEAYNSGDEGSPSDLGAPPDPTGRTLGALRNAGSEAGGTVGHCGRRGTRPVRLSFRSVSTSSESSSRALAAMRATREASRRARRVSVSALGEVVSVESGMRVAKRMRDEAVIDASASGCRFRQQRPPTPHLACKHPPDLSVGACDVLGHGRVRHD